MSLTVRRIPHGSADYAAAVNLRRAVLRTPLGLDFTSAQLAAATVSLTGDYSSGFTGTVSVAVP